MAESNCTHQACTKCLAVKPLEEFYKNTGMTSGRLRACKKCVVAANVRRNQSPKIKAQRAAAAAKKWREDPVYRERKSVAEKKYFSRPDVVEKMRLRALASRARNPEHHRQLSRATYQRLRDNPIFMLARRISAGLRHSMKAKTKSSRTFDLLGYTPEELADHLERQFVSGMSWGNMGEWHIDHIVPLSSFKIADEQDPQLRQAWCLTNLRPIWATDNMRKHAKRLFLI